MRIDAEPRELAASTNESMLLRVTESARLVTRAECAYVALHATPPGTVEVVASAGTGAPPPRRHLALPDASAPDRTVLPLLLDGEPIGALIAEGVAGALTPQAERELTLLGDVAAVALHNHVLVVEAERRAMEQARLHYRLLSGAIYHLKNTLSAASEYNQLLDLEDAVSDSQREYISRSQRSIATALRLLTELHELGRTDAGELIPQPEPLNVAALVRDILRDYRLATGTAGIVFELDAADAPPIRTDPDCVRQIVDALLSNAVRYSPTGESIRVRLSLHEGRRSGDPSAWLRIDVSDRGPGVHEEQQVFQEVQRVERKGLPGFRLAISRRIARLLGGDLTLHTEAGVGSTFSLWLPQR